MPDTNWYILTGPVQTGKTTSLLQGFRNRNDLQGILTPVQNGSRVFMNIHTGEQFPMEALPGEKETLAVGRFHFSKSGFEKATAVIRKAIHTAGWLIIDEIGPLELKGGGFHDVLQEVIAERKGKTLLVVREGLTATVQHQFGFTASIRTDTGFI
ncbi:MAG: nucleoside-triphosphatase [Chitinophagaceae bacterium]